MKKDYCIGQFWGWGCNQKCRMEWKNWWLVYKPAQNQEFKTCKEEQNFIQKEDNLAKKINKAN